MADEWIEKIRPPMSGDATLIIPGMITYVMADKKLKQDVRYTPHAAVHNERCALCKHFQRLYDKCTKVEGRINPAGWCQLWTKK
jgi:hypothetical protein